MRWKNILTEKELEQALAENASEPVVFFKHSTRCSVSMFVKKQFESACSELSTRFSFFLVNVLDARPVSNLLAEKFSIQHESPQVIVVTNGEATHTASHNHISGEKVNELLS